MICLIFGHIKEYEDIVFTGGLFSGRQYYQCRRCHKYFFDYVAGMGDIGTQGLTYEEAEQYKKALDNKLNPPKPKRKRKRKVEKTKKLFITDIIN